jgi:hypothetical protein
MDGGEQCQARMQGAPGVVFMRLRPTKIDQEAISQLLRNMAAVALDHCCTDGVIPSKDVVEVFGVEPPGEGGRVHHVTKQHGELPTFGPRGGGADRGHWERRAVEWDKGSRGVRRYQGHGKRHGLAWWPRGLAAPGPPWRALYAHKGMRIRLRAATGSGATGTSPVVSPMPTGSTAPVLSWMAPHLGGLPLVLRRLGPCGYRQRLRLLKTRGL